MVITADVHNTTTKSNVYLNIVPVRVEVNGKGTHN